MDDETWASIKREYTVKLSTQKALAEKYGIPMHKLARRCREEGWTSIKRENSKRAADKKKLGGRGGVSPRKKGKRAVENGFSTYENGGIDLKKRILNLTERAVSKTGEAVAQLETQLVKGKAVDTGMVDMQRLRQIVQTVKDLRDITKDLPGESGADATQKKLVEALRAAAAEAEGGNDV